MGYLTNKVLLVGEGLAPPVAELAVANGDGRHAPAGILRRHENAFISNVAKVIFVGYLTNKVLLVGEGLAPPVAELAVANGDGGHAPAGILRRGVNAFISNVAKVIFVGYLIRRGDSRIARFHRRQVKRVGNIKNK